MKERPINYIFDPVDTTTETFFDQAPSHPLPDADLSEARAIAQRAWQARDEAYEAMLDTGQFDYARLEQMYQEAVAAQLYYSDLYHARANGLPFVAVTVGERAMVGQEI